MALLGFSIFLADASVQWQMVIDKKLILTWIV